jgi:hypothetical protein
MGVGKFWGIINSESDRKWYKVHEKKSTFFSIASQRITIIMKKKKKKSSVHKQNLPTSALWHHSYTLYFHYECVQALLIQLHKKKFVFSITLLTADLKKKRKKTTPNS